MDCNGGASTLSLILTAHEVTCKVIPRDEERAQREKARPKSLHEEGSGKVGLTTSWRGCLTQADGGIGLDELSHGSRKSYQGR